MSKTYFEKVDQMRNEVLPCLRGVYDDHVSGGVSPNSVVAGINYTCGKYNVLESKTQKELGNEYGVTTATVGNWAKKLEAEVVGQLEKNEYLHDVDDWLVAARELFDCDSVEKKEESKADVILSVANALGWEQGNQYRELDTWRKSGGISIPQDTLREMVNATGALEMLHVFKNDFYFDLDDDVTITVSVNKTGWEKIRDMVETDVSGGG